MINYGNSMVGGECDEFQIPVPPVCEEDDDWTSCDFCGEPVRIRHFCPECSRFCEERTEEVAS